VGCLTSYSPAGNVVSLTVNENGTRNDPVPAYRVQRKLRSVSPDGHWVAYTSDESGRDEIYVRDFSSGSAQGSWGAASRWLISKSGGTSPRWGGDGKELFYGASDGKLMAVNISSKPVFQAGAPRPLFQLPPGFIGGDVTADGKRFLVGVPVGQSASVPFTVVLNWQTALKK
jgi:eukaryotic-like serine/threonine-protein kinase